MDSRPFSDLEKRTALRLKSEGWKHLAIATELGRTSAGLAGFFRRQRVADGRPPTRIVRPYTEDEDQILLELRKDGQTYREIGTLLGRDIGSLYSRHKLLSEPPPKTSSRWTAKEVDELIRQHDQGVGIKDIAAALGRRALSVKDKLLGTLARRGRTDVPLDYGTRNKRQGPHH
ncbi:hypothetical protein CERZMDRAFT_85633 [Cercospora zeae-maydis SCOH1-5]|uniref:Transposase IS30-like HTH domain-containing protein n=1 Tax=Cercospora zeae-maydis SCOH1-5 TaxID=717836 RepID=A0A6A6FCC9_9PEZI|nr:hypothetical protein CERZMDRAFT_85633 [Cercospora zeae-maydis SCOH1-5]